MGLRTSCESSELHLAAGEWLSARSGRWRRRRRGGSVVKTNDERRQRKSLARSSMSCWCSSSSIAWRCMKYDDLVVLLQSSGFVGSMGMADGRTKG